jgi:PKD repeat protein
MLELRERSLFPLFRWGHGCLLALAALSGCGGERGTPAGPTAAGMVTANLTVSIDAMGSAVAVSGVSQVRFDARASSGPAELRYFIDYGDNSSSLEGLSQHTYESPGTYTMSVTVSDVSGHRAMTSKTITVRSVEGSWFHAAVNAQTRRFELRRLVVTSQRGRNVQGEFSTDTGVPVSVSGDVDGERTIRFKIAGQPEVTGTIPSEVFGDGVLFQLRGFAGTDGQALPFRPIVGQPTGAAPAARLNVYIDDAGSTGAIMGFTPMRFSAAEPVAQSSLYFIDFGDGEYATGASAVHPCGRIGVLKSRLIVVDPFARMSSNTSIYACLPIFDAGGLGDRWLNSIENPTAGRRESRQLRFRTQSGHSLVGSYSHPEGYSSPVTATLSGQNSIRIALDDGTMVLSGDVTIKDVFDESGSYSSNRHLVLKVKGGSADGMTLDFRLYQPY